MHKVFYRLSTAALYLGLLLGSWNNHVALFSKNEDTPLKVYPVALDVLPEADRKSLIEGIPIKNAAELQRLLEDFLS